MAEAVGRNVAESAPDGAGPMPAAGGAGARGELLADAASRPEPLEVTYLGRSTVLLGMDGTRLLTDPSLPVPARLPWGRRVAPVELPRVDAVLVSHSHRRHMDAGTLRRLPGSPRILVAAGSATALVRAGIEGIEELAAGDSVRVGSVVVQAIGAAHGTLHGVLASSHDPVGFLVDGSSRVYFAGDSVPFSAMERLTDVDLALLPVAPVLRYVGHLSPAAAAETAAIVRPRMVVPIHWGALHEGPVASEEQTAPWMPSQELFTPERLESALRRAFESRGVAAELRMVAAGYSTTLEPVSRAAPVAGGPVVTADRHGLGRTAPETPSAP